jgi:hypothetical protein
MSAFRGLLTNHTLLALNPPKFHQSSHPGSEYPCSPASPKFLKSEVILNACPHGVYTINNVRPYTPRHATSLGSLTHTEHSFPILGSLEGHQLTYAMYFSIFPMIITVIFRLMLWRLLAQLEDACRLPQGVFNDARDDIHVCC